jgi:DNA-binding SARP family transcriptional activator
MAHSARSSNLRMRRAAAAQRDPSMLQIRCFGRFEVLRDGQPVQHWRRDRARTLLKYLVVHGRPVARDVLLELLWSGADPAVAARSLRVVLHALRHAVGTWGDTGRHEYVVAEGEQLLLHPAAPVWIDTRAFLDHVQTADALERSGQGGLAARLYAEAEHIYRDDYLIDDMSEPWTVLRREELKDRYLVVLARLADHYLDSGDVTACIARCHKLLSQDPCREDAYQRLMYCDALLGQRSRGLHWFHMCESVLRQELGIGPGERTRFLAQRIASASAALPPLAWVTGLASTGHAGEGT